MGRALFHNLGSGWNPLWLGSGLVAWWDPEIGVTKDGITNRVSAWADRIAATSLVQAAGAAQFLWQAAASEMNGRASLYGDANRFMGIVSAPVALRVTQQAHTFLLVTRASGDQVGNGTAAGSMLLMRYSSKVRTHIWATGALATRDGLTTISPTTQQLVGQIATGAPGTGVLTPILNGASDNTSVAIGGTATTPNPSFVLGSRGFGVGSDTLNGYVGDVFIFNRALTSEELIQMARWTSLRWSI